MESFKVDLRCIFIIAEIIYEVGYTQDHYTDADHMKKQFNIIRIHVHLLASALKSI